MRYLGQISSRREFHYAGMWFRHSFATSIGSAAGGDGEGDAGDADFLPDVATGAIFLPLHVQWDERRLG